MINRILKHYCSSSLSLRRLPKKHWLSLTYPLSNESVQKDDQIVIRKATDKDITFLENHDNSADNIIKSSLKFWHEYGFRSLYLGFFDGEEDPTVFQFVLDDQSNHLYAGMDYGAMYGKQHAQSVQVENIYLFRSKRKKKAALRFEHHLFAMLLEQGKREVRTHIAIDNRPALLWARTVGFRPDKWITLVSFNLPGLRHLRKHFFHLPLQENERTKFPLKLFPPQE